MTAFFGVWRFTRRKNLFSNSRTVSLSGSEWVLPNRAARCKKHGSLRLHMLAELPEGSGLKPFSVPAEARLCVYSLVRNAGIEPATNRVVVDSSTAELKTQFPLRRARLSRFTAF